MTRYGLEMADKHMKILYEQLDTTEKWIERYSKELTKLQTEKEALEQRIIKSKEFIQSEKERLNESSI